MWDNICDMERPFQSGSVWRFYHGNCLTDAHLERVIPLTQFCNVCATCMVGVARSSAVLPQRHNWIDLAVIATKGTKHKDILVYRGTAEDFEISLSACRNSTHTYIQSHKHSLTATHTPWWTCWEIVDLARERCWICACVCVCHQPTHPPVCGCRTAYGSSSNGPCVVAPSAGRKTDVLWGVSPAEMYLKTHWRTLYHTYSPHEHTQVYSGWLALL